MELLLLMEDRRLWGATTYWGIPNHQAASSLLPPHLTRNGVALSLSGSGLFSLSSGMGSVKPQYRVLWVCVRRGGWRCREARATHCCLHRPGVPSPSSVKWLKKYLSHKRNEARAAKGGVWASGLHRPQGPLCSDLCQAPHRINGSQCLLTKYKALNPLLASPSNICVLRNLWLFLPLPEPPPHQAALAPELLPCWHLWP